MSKFKMAVFVSIICSAFGCVMSVSGDNQADGNMNTIVVDGIERSYIVYNPGIPVTKRVPLMIVLHGGMGNAEHTQATVGMDDVADQGQFIVAYPNGIGGRFAIMENKRTWNAGRCCGQAVQQNIDDVRFIERMIDEINSKFQIDMKRIYVTGMSNGAMMAYRLACDIPDKIAAIVPVSGTLAVDNCDSAIDIPVLHIHGELDENVPFHGGKGAKGISGVAHRSVPDTMDRMTRPRQCRAPEEITRQNGKIQEISYHCSGGAPVQLLIIKGGGHVWPGGSGRLNRQPEGVADISASRTAWNFAKQFAKKH
jgi:polyhydroxybutyrate depolymerase